MTTATEQVTADSTMADVLRVFPGAQRALFRRYHIGGCSSCGFQPTETLAELCARNGSLGVDEVLAHIRTSHEQDETVLIAAPDLAALLHGDEPPRLVDIRSREEFEAVHIEGAVLLTQDVMQEMLGRWPRDEMFVVIDHQGRSCLDAAAYFLGHGFTSVRALRGGIDAWSQEVDAKLARYRLGS